MEKEIKIISPEGYEINTQNSTFECIKFKEKVCNIVRVTQLAMGCNRNCHINGDWAFTVFEEEQQGIGYLGSEISGHKAIMYLNDNHGLWYDEKGNRIEGYIYYKPID